MPNELTIAARLAEELGPELCQACQRNDVAQVQSLTADLSVCPHWTPWTAAAAVVAAFEGAADVARFCMQYGQRCYPKCAASRIVKLVWQYESLEPAYRFLVDNELMAPDHHVEHFGSLLGILAGQRRDKARHSLVKYMLQKGDDRNQPVDLYGGMRALVATAGWSDPQMLGLLLDHGAILRGSGAVIFAAQKGDVENVRYLLDRGANVNETVPLELSRPGLENACTAMHAAIENGHGDVVDLLLSAGADLTLEDAKGRTALEIARAKGMDLHLTTLH